MTILLIEPYIYLGRNLTNLDVFRANNGNILKSNDNLCIVKKSVFIIKQNVSFVASLVLILLHF